MSIVNNKLSPTLTTLLNELRDECLSAIKLIHQLNIENLTEEQIEDVLCDLTASITHLQTHSVIAKEELDKV